MSSNMVTCIQERPLKRRPKLTELPDLFNHFGGNIQALAKATGYSRDQVYVWINEAAPPIKEALLEKLEQSRVKYAQDKLIADVNKELRKEIPAFVIPSEIKQLVSLYYRLSEIELSYIDITDMLKDMDADPEKPSTLRYKMDWADLKSAVLDLDNGFEYAALIRPSKIVPGVKWDRKPPERLGGPVVIGGVTYEWWNQHVLMSWVGLYKESPLHELHEYSPELFDEIERPDGSKSKEVKQVFLEPVLRLLIKRLEKYL